MLPKYRGKHIVTGDYIYGSPIQIIDSNTGDKRILLFPEDTTTYPIDTYFSEFWDRNNSNCVEIDPETLALFTGKHDINGCPIYVGDVCKSMLSIDNCGERLIEIEVLLNSNLVPIFYNEIEGELAFVSSIDNGTTTKPGWFGDLFLSEIEVVTTATNKL